jgi:hypothetical protein
MTSDPVYEGGKLIGHDHHYPAVMITVRDARGYDQLIPAVAEREVFVPVTRQRDMLEEE